MDLRLTPEAVMHTREKRFIFRSPDGMMWVLVVGKNSPHQFGTMDPRPDHFGQLIESGRTHRPLAAEVVRQLVASARQVGLIGRDDVEDM